MNCGNTLYGEVGLDAVVEALQTSTPMGGRIRDRQAQVAASFANRHRTMVCSGCPAYYFDREAEAIPDDTRIVYEAIGSNLEPSEITTALEPLRLKRLACDIAERRSNFAAHLEFFRGAREWFHRLHDMLGARTRWLAFQLTIRDDASFTRRDLQIWVEEADDQTRSVFSGNYLRRPAFRDVGARSRAAGYPVADAVMRGRVLRTFHHGLARDHLAHLYAGFERFARSVSKESAA